MLYASTAGRDEKDNRLGNKRATAILEKFLALNYSESQRRRWLSICSQLLRFGWLLINFLARCNFPVLSETLSGAMAHAVSRTRRPMSLSPLECLHGRSFQSRFERIQIINHLSNSICRRLQSDLLWTCSTGRKITSKWRMRTCKNWWSKSMFACPARAVTIPTTSADIVAPSRAKRRNNCFRLRVRH